MVKLILICLISENKVHFHHDDIGKKLEEVIEQEQYESLLEEVESKKKDNGKKQLLWVFAIFKAHHLGVVCNES